jgi:hypothetical protein
VTPLSLQLIDDLGIVEMAVPDAVFGALKGAPAKVAFRLTVAGERSSDYFPQVGALDRFKK